MKNFYAPYIIEYFFKDSRYMVIDNQPVVCVFGADKYATKIGGNAKMKDAFDVLENEAKKLGFAQPLVMDFGIIGFLKKRLVGNK